MAGGKKASGKKEPHAALEEENEKLRASNAELKAYVDDLLTLVEKTYEPKVKRYRRQISTLLRERETLRRQVRNVPQKMAPLKALEYHNRKMKTYSDDPFEAIVAVVEYGEEATRETQEPAFMFLASRLADWLYAPLINSKKLLSIEEALGIRAGGKGKTSPLEQYVITYRPRLVLSMYKGLSAEARSKSRHLRGQLSPREWAIHEIADRLHLSASTVERDLKLSKLG